MALALRQHQSDYIMDVDIARPHPRMQQLAAALEHIILLLYCSYSEHLDGVLYCNNDVVSVRIRNICML
jgi:hypothetical protein